MAIFNSFVKLPEGIIGIVFTFFFPGLSREMKLRNTGWVLYIIKDKYDLHTYNYP